MSLGTDSGDHMSVKVICATHISSSYICYHPIDRRKVMTEVYKNQSVIKVILNTIYNDTIHRKYMCVINQFNHLN